LNPNPLTTATAKINELVTRRNRPLSVLEATFTVAELMTEADAHDALDRLIAKRFLARDDADLAQMLAQKLGRPVQWSHTRFGVGEWVGGRGSNDT
jgi:hypothetical protein